MGDEPEATNWSERVRMPCTGIYRSDGRTPVKRHRHSAATFVDVAMEATLAGHGCRLVLRVSAYEWPDEVSGSDANWLTGEVELQAGRTGVFHARHGAALRTEELAQFRDQLQEVVASLNGTATLHHLESQVGCTVELANGRGNLSAFIKERRVGIVRS